MLFFLGNYRKHLSNAAHKHGVIDSENKKTGRYTKVYAKGASCTGVF